MNDVRLLACTCTSPFQDERYGKGLRVHIEKNKANSPTFTCTVCGKERSK